MQGTGVEMLPDFMSSRSLRCCSVGRLRALNLSNIGHRLRLHSIDRLRPSDLYVFKHLYVFAADAVRSCQLISMSSTGVEMFPDFDHFTAIPSMLRVLSVSR